MNKISIMIADDHPLVLNGLASMINVIPEFNLMGMAKNGQELIDMVKLNPPDIAIVDLEMPVLNGLETIKELTKNFQSVKSIVMSSHYQDFFVQEFLLIGARGYLPKNAEMENFVSAIYEVYNDGFCFDTKIAKSLINRGFRKELFKSQIEKMNFSERELEILKLICEEKTNPIIGEQIGISADTVDYHRRNILKKTQLKTAIGLVKYAIDKGLA